MRLLVTGGAGFIGSNFIRFFLRAHPDGELINLDKLTYAGNLQNLSDVETNPHYSFQKGDIGDAGLIRTVEWYRNHADWIQKAKSGEYREYYERFYVNRGTALAQI